MTGIFNPPYTPPASGPKLDVEDGIPPVPPGGGTPEGPGAIPPAPPPPPPPPPPPDEPGTPPSTPPDLPAPGVPVPTPETLEELLVLIRSDLTLLIRLINEESRKDAIEDTIGSIKAKGQERIEKLNEQIKEIEKQLEASKEAASSSKTKSILGWIGAALAVVAAVAAVIATAGAATPLLVGACIMVGVAVASLGMQIAQEATGGAYFPGKGISMMLQAMGVDEKTADIAGMVVVGGLMLIASVTAAILSFGAGSGGAVSNIANMAKLIRTAAAVANSAMAITSGALAIDSALDKYESDLAGATLKEIQALLEKLKALTEQEEDFLRALMAEEKTITDLVDRIVESAMAAIQSMAGNIAAPGMA